MEKLFLSFRGRHLPSPGEVLGTGQSQSWLGSRGWE